MKSSPVLVGAVYIGLLFLSVGTNANEDPAAFDPVTQDIVDIDKNHPPSFHELFIPSHGVLLTGFMLGANGPGPHPTVVLLHGYPGNEKNLDLAQSMRRAGFNVLFFHYRGAWGSQGDYALFNMAEDVASVLTFLRQHVDELGIDTGRLSIVGHSMGGFAALRSAARDAEVVCVAGISAANMGLNAGFEESRKQGFKALTDKLFMLRNFSGDKALEELETYSEEFDLRNEGPALKGKSVLLIAASEDAVVPPSIQESIAAAYGRVDGFRLQTQVIAGDHLFSESRILLQTLVIDWLQADCQ